jgi:hypothetical protein
MALPDIHTRQTSYLVTAILVLLGIIAVLLADLSRWSLLGAMDSWQRELLKSLGVFLISVLAVAWLYDRLLIERHFSQFRSLITEQLSAMDNVQSGAIRMGLVELYETRTAYDIKHSFAERVRLTKDGGHIFCVARSLFHLLNKEAEVKAALSRGINLQLACLDPDAVSEEMKQLTLVYPEDIRSAIISLKNIAYWAKKHSPPGSIELRFHRLYLPDSCLLIDTAEGPQLTWDLSFGRDLNDKRVLLLKPSGSNLGENLAKRYEQVWLSSRRVFEMKNGQVLRDFI